MQIALRIGASLFGLAGAILLFSYGIAELIDRPEFREGDIEKNVADGAFLLWLAAFALIGSVGCGFSARARRSPSGPG